MRHAGKGVENILLDKYFFPRRLRMPQDSRSRSGNVWIADPAAQSVGALAKIVDI
jgi:hypothetical protein